ncbi:DUF1707 SHOCT-like domain-containing protein [Mycobacterium hubeiense]|uniref:DUF1707 SHOCT-like domain-containing protein n=1 Tax=Mycobacterium hubeiense TaxID=1867256 RepID=UPI001E44A81A|nr:DUF1707 domain-containing protein [Mycobacterium sp. QGD 101]
MATRARDSDRTATCQALDDALAEGQLTMAEHQHRVAIAIKATTLGELQGLVTDLQPSYGAIERSTPNRSRRMVATTAATAALLAVLGLISWGLFGHVSSPDPAAESPVQAVESPAPTKAAEPKPDEVAPEVLIVPREFHTVDGLTGLIEQIRKRFGDTMGIELAVTPDEAYLYRADPTDDQVKLLYRYQGGWGDPSRKLRDATDVPADLAAFDVPAATEMLRNAPATLGIDPADVSGAFLDVDHIQDPAGPGALELLIKVDTKSGGSGLIYLDGASNIKRVEYPS